MMPEVVCQILRQQGGTSMNFGEDFPPSREGNGLNDASQGKPLVALVPFPRRRRTTADEEYGEWIWMRSATFQVVGS